MYPLPSQISPLGLITRDFYNHSTVQFSNAQQLLKYMSLEQKGKVMAEYVWIDSCGGTRSKTKVCRHHTPLQLAHARETWFRAENAFSLVCDVVGCAAPCVSAMAISACRHGGFPFFDCCTR